MLTSREDGKFLVLWKKQEWGKEEGREGSGGGLGKSKPGGRITRLLEAGGLQV